MTDPSDYGLRTLPLGFAPGTGRVTVDQVSSFKEKLRDKLKQRDPEGAWLETVVDGERRGVQVVYDPETPGASEWASRAFQAAEGIWEAIGKAAQKKVRSPV